MRYEEDSSVLVFFKRSFGFASPVFRCTTTPRKSLGIKTHKYSSSFFYKVRGLPCPTDCSFLSRHILSGAFRVRAHPGIHHCLDGLSIEFHNFQRNDVDYFRFYLEKFQELKKTVTIIPTDLVIWKN